MPDDETVETDDKIPRARLNAEIAKRTAAEQRANELAQQIQAAKDAAAAEVAAAKALAAEHQTALQRLQSQHETFRVGVGAGLDEEGIGVAQVLYERIPAEGRKPLAETLAAWKADPASAPRPLQPYWAAAQPQPGTQPKPVVKPTGTVVTPTPGGSSPLTAEQIAAVQKRCSESGDWTEWKAIRGQAYAGG